MAAEDEKKQSSSGNNNSGGGESHQEKKAKISENVWSSLLGKVAARGAGKQPNSTLLVLGDKNNGKGHVLRKFRERVFNPDSQEYLLDYSYCVVKDRHDPDTHDDVLAYMNMWRMDHAEHENILPMLLQPWALKHAVYMVTLDLSKPWDVERSLNKWLKVLEGAHKALFQQLRPDRQKQLLRKIAKYNSTFVDVAVRKAEREATEKIMHGDDDGSAAADATLTTDTHALHDEMDDETMEYDGPQVNLGVPLIVVACKADMLRRVNKSMPGVGNRFEYVARKLRQKCLEYGATLVFTSSAGEGTNIDVLQDYIYHRLYNTPLTHASVLAGTEAEFGLFVPAGGDNETLINTLKPEDTPFPDEMGFHEVFPKPQAKTVLTAVTKNVEVEAQDNDTFLETIDNMLKQTHGDNIGSSSSSSNRVRAAAVSAKGASGSSGGDSRKSTSGKVHTRGSSGSTSKIRSSASSTSVSGDGRTRSKTTKGAPKKKDQKAVKDFFRSLLTSTDAGKKKNNRANAEQFLKNIKDAKKK
eukprot:TRINITY_DN57330_c0_g1_i1.p1 TRINITY_DN57330_c0_g1~~TRINITY_DN57330_c0_g1_i1.p1  ORF type:complete len:539 (-),score=322.28 TRINITY_DN57330_c0_g1_i1:68-1645(-)